MKYEREVELIKNGGVGVIPTDTIYGLVCSALLPTSVEKIYHLKNRDSRKPPIVLISGLDDLKLFGVQIDNTTRLTIEEYWPGPITIILPCSEKSFFYIHRGTQTIAFRLPDVEWLTNFISVTGPLIAPSANIEGQTPARNIDEARQYFGKEVDFYIDGGQIDAPPSKILTIVDGQKVWIR